MSNIIPFYFDKKPIRVITDESGEPLIVGKDICNALGPDGHPKLLHLWPPKLLQAGRPN